MQTFRPELISHMDARREQREAAAAWRLAGAGKRGERSRRVRPAAPAGSGSQPEPQRSSAPG